jgi:hypothetical protein
MSDPQLREHYTKILRAGWDSARGEPVSDEHDAEGLRSILLTSEQLADQFEHSIMDAPWLRGPTHKIISDWLETADEEGVVDLRVLTSSLEGMYGVSRALMIARTEVGLTYNGAHAAALRSNGWKMVDWLAAPGACEECQAFADSSPMSIEEYEANVGPHPNCSCDVAPSEAEGEGTGEEEVEEAS